MKVIKAGRPQKGWAKEFKCTGGGNEGGGCGATLLVEQGDLFFTHSSHYDGSNETYVTFECPSCNVLTDVTVPGSVSSKIPQNATRPSKRSTRGTDL